MGRAMPDAAKGVRQLVLLHGRDPARSMINADEVSLVRIASEALEDETGRSGYSYSGLCLTSLPHRKPETIEPWVRTLGPLTMIVEPGHIKLDDGPPVPLGVPYGARARLILIYLQTQAILSKSREVSLGRSMREWTGRMGMSVGGETARALREQARRIATCSIRFSWRLEKEGRQAAMMTNERIIKSGLFFQDHSDGRQESLFEDRVLLDADFFEQLRRHPVPLRDAAIHELKDSSAALDIYVWLAYRLHHLSKRTPIGWRDLYTQFGAGYQHMTSWKQQFMISLAEAVAAYPEARVEVEDTCLAIYPSPPPQCQSRPWGKHMLPRQRVRGARPLCR
jgi:hypothetical protein